VNWAAQGAFGTDFHDRPTRTIVGTMLWTEYRPIIKIGPKGALGSHEIRPIHSAPSLGQSITFKPAYMIENGSRQSGTSKLLVFKQLGQHKLWRVKVLHSKTA